MADRNAIFTRLTSGLLTALLSSRPGLYPRHRWTGCDLATDDVGIVEACHSLPSTTYRRFVNRAGLARAQLLVAAPTLLRRTRARTRQGSTWLR